MEIKGTYLTKYQIMEAAKTDPVMKKVLDHAVSHLAPFTLDDVEGFDIYDNDGKVGIGTIFNKDKAITLEQIWNNRETIGTVTIEGNVATNKKEDSIVIK